MSSGDIEIGKTYAFQGWPDSQHGRKALVLGKLAADLYLIRWPDGQERELAAHQMRGPVTPARPGIDEPCLRCLGRKEIEIQGHDPERPWIIHAEGAEPCPNCSAT